MAGKIVFYDFTRSALSFPSDANLAGSRYGECPDDALLDFSTGDFAIEFQAMWDSTIANPASNKFIVAKNMTWGMANQAGWQICLTPNTESLTLHLNDGSATEVSSAWAGVWSSNTNTFFRLELDRNVGTTLYKNGVLVSTKTEITGRTGSVSNASALMIGAHNMISDAFKGSIDLLRIDTGVNQFIDNAGTLWSYDTSVSYGEVWNYENYLKVYYFWPEELWHYRASWYFNNSLVDLSPTGHTFVFKDGNGAGATATYTSSSFSPSFSFTSQPLMGSHEWGPLDLDNRQRSLDGTMRIYKVTNKLHKSWAFRTNSIEQIYALMSAWYSQAPLQIYDDATLPFFMRGFIVSPPIVKELIHTGAETLAALRRIWEVQLEFEEL